MSKCMMLSLNPAKKARIRWKLLKYNYFDYKNDKKHPVIKFVLKHCINLTVDHVARAAPGILWITWSHLQHT